MADKGSDNGSASGVSTARAPDSAVCYNEVSFVQRGDGMKLLNRLSPQINDVVMDLGCGTGYLASVLAERVGPGGRVVAVDPDGERIKVAKESYACDNVRFLVASGEDFPEDQYDIVFSSSVLHWIKDKEAVFKRVYKHLKPGGRFGFTTQDSSKLSPRKIKLMAKFNEMGGHWQPRVYYQTRTEMEELATSVGFQIAVVEVVCKKNTWPTMDDFLQFMFGVLHGHFDPSTISKETLEMQQCQWKYQGLQPF